MSYYIATHWSQYADGQSAATRRFGCTWTTVANGIAAVSGGTHRPTPDTIHALVPSGQETNPQTPGWSIADAVKAMHRYGFGSLDDRTGAGWAQVIDALNEGQYVLLQGDSDRFGNATCSGDFDGDHCIGISPNRRTVDTHREWYINDPICPGGRWERESVLRDYAEKLWAGIRFGAFSPAVPSYAWRWQGHPPLIVFFDVDAAAGTWTRRRQVGTKGTRQYQCSPPGSFKHDPPAGADFVGRKSLVQLRQLVKGGKGAYTGRWVNADHATRVLTGGQ